MKKQTNRTDAQFMIPLAAFHQLTHICKATGYTQTQAVVVAVETYATQVAHPIPKQRTAERAPLRLVLPRRTGLLLDALRAGQRVSRQDVISEALRTYTVRS